MTPPSQTRLTELEPCPFCGTDAILRDADERTQFYVVCGSLDCFAAVGEGYDRDAMADHTFHSADEAIAAWNRRALPSPAAVAGGVLRLPLYRDGLYRIIDADDLWLADATNTVVADAIVAACNARPAPVAVAHPEDMVSVPRHNAERILSALQIEIRTAPNISNYQLRWFHAAQQDAEALQRALAPPAPYTAAGEA